ncbi:SAM-dependent methyltransferase [Prauserella sp. PE36]|uniref:Class I SAM-dependent methyltransferase n=1 Tax=Prauserella endophytica TaxID=1592324 RepID=A0ABY2S9P9_9PSEU|nr:MULTISPECIES: class I SAM-dependent methyltransferase [Prauserella]RBM21039.1 SAM-dependent methyltransferase [Prauserella sp. PE36]TKG72181.1 class I SAM-dependent methyltransferase [Prauserella endophytica]
MIHEHPLAYLLGIEGLGLLRAFSGEYDQAFVASRIAEVRELLADERLANAAVDVERVGTVEGYRAWAPAYDAPGNAAFDLDEPVVIEILDRLPAGVALDAACGTGRYARLLAERGHRVLGVDSSPDMLARARTRVPDGDFRLGDLRELPVRDDHVDLVVCALALTHAPELGPVLAEFARVLRPGGHLVIADIHPEAVLRGSVPAVRGPGGEPRRLVTHRHLVGDYLRAALPLGLIVRRCEEPRPPAREPDAGPANGSVSLEPWDLWPWSLAGLVPEAAWAANAGVPALLVWHFQLEGPRSTPE